MPITVNTAKYAGVGLTDRMWAKVAKSSDEDGCWLWIGHCDTGGYGRVKVGGRGSLVAHRVFYTALVGDVPEGLELDHLCVTRNCVNPAHLEPVTHAENVRRGRVGERQRQTTHCPSGHPYEGSNLRSGPYGRACRTCNNEACARYRQRKKEAMYA